MIVSRLIEELQKMPIVLPVRFDWSGDGIEVETVDVGGVAHWKGCSCGEFIFLEPS